MKRTLTITLEFDDEIGEAFPIDAVKYAMDEVDDMVLYSGSDFVSAKLDEEVLVDRNGYISAEVKKREAQHQTFVRKVGRRLFGKPDMLDGTEKLL